ncbi:uncharacterized protein LOC130104226 [Rhinichthys klamathensis goyatoka]|uniref:uncharacterized protein LOC130104226 n=1 Tax=Rhinichthys klamathensis goyatoka TaxID=3034132 RepID=UPI0024B614FF|nr:uncharacterized protein LOC130104226 [Rhinichthys klamathensis goyatoka]
MVAVDYRRYEEGQGSVFSPGREVPENAQALEERRTFMPEILLNSYFIAGLNAPPPLTEREGLIRRPFREVVDHVCREELQGPTRTMPSFSLPVIPEGRVLAVATLGDHVLSTSTPETPAIAVSLRGKRGRRVSWESASEASSTESALPVAVLPVSATAPAVITLPITSPAMASAPRPRRKRRKRASCPQSPSGSVLALQPAAAIPVHVEVNGKVTESSPVPVKKSIPVHAEVDGKVTESSPVPAKESIPVHADGVGKVTKLSPIPAKESSPVPASQPAAAPFVFVPQSPVAPPVSVPLLVPGSPVLVPVTSPLPAAAAPALSPVVPPVTPATVLPRSVLPKTVPYVPPPRPVRSPCPQPSPTSICHVPCLTFP